jgi:hypothetical protein
VRIGEVRRGGRRGEERWRTSQAILSVKGLDHKATDVGTVACGWESFLCLSSIPDGVKERVYPPHTLCIIGLDLREVRRKRLGVAVWLREVIGRDELRSGQVIRVKDNVGVNKEKTEEEQWEEENEVQKECELKGEFGEECAMEKERESEDREDSDDEREGGEMEKIRERREELLESLRGPNSIARRSVDRSTRCHLEGRRVA